MDLNSKFTVDEENITFRVIDNEAVILNLENGYYYGLNAVGTEIWNRLSGRKSLADILAWLAKEYPESEKQLKQDMLELVNDLEAEKLISRA